MAPPLDPGQRPTRTYFIAVYVFSIPEQGRSSYKVAKKKYVTVVLVLPVLRLPPKCIKGIYATSSNVTMAEKERQGFEGPPVLPILLSVTRATKVRCFVFPAGRIAIPLYSDTPTLVSSIQPFSGHFCDVLNNTLHYFYI